MSEIAVKPRGRSLSEGALMDVLDEMQSPNEAATDSSLGPDASEATRKLCIVIKIGSSSLVKTVDNGPFKDTFLSLNRISATIEAICELRRAGHDVALVSSGAVGTGCHCLGLTEKPSKLSLATRQALAAIGQVHLMGKYESLFATMKQNCAQVLLTFDSFNSKTQFLNSSNTFRELFRMGVIPIINENDTVATQEMQSDNDTLASLVASMVGADMLFLLTDVDGLYTSNPQKDPSAKLIRKVDDISQLDKLCKTTDGKSSWGTGGMSSKISAARLATSTGVDTIVMNALKVGDVVDYVTAVANNENGAKSLVCGTVFSKARAPPKKHKRWIRGLRCRGSVVIDKGASNAVRKRYSLFAVGIIAVEGAFDFMDAVRVLDENRAELATGLCNYSSRDLKKIIGKRSQEIFELGLGNSDNAVISRRNLVVQSRKVDTSGVAGVSERSYASSESD